MIPKEALQVGLADLRTASASLFPQMSACGILWGFGELEWCHSFIALFVSG
jgi:hypothetical protein